MIDWDYERDLMFEIVRLKAINKELLEFAKAYIGREGDSGHFEHELDEMARAAIAKATGVPERRLTPQELNEAKARALGEAREREKREKP